MTEKEYEILNTTFFDIEDFCKHEEIRDENDIDETELRKRSAIALEKLKKMEQEPIDKSLHRSIGVNVNLYIEYISAYLNGRISVNCFKYIYNKCFTENSFKMTGDEYEVLNELYVGLDSLGSVELIRHCKITTEKLKMIL